MRLELEIPVTSFYKQTRMGKRRKGVPKKVKKVDKPEKTSKSDDTSGQEEETHVKVTGADTSGDVACVSGPSPCIPAGKKRSLSASLVTVTHQKEEKESSQSPSPTQLKIKRSKMDLQKAREALKFLQSMGSSLLESDRFVSKWRTTGKKIL